LSNQASEFGFDSVQITAGDTVTVTFSNPVGEVDSSALRVGDFTRVAFGTVPDVLTYTFLFTGEVNVYGEVAGGGTALITFACAPASQAVSPGAVSSIPAWVQAYGRASADAKCQDGWDASWQAWAEPVTGGWVCTRSIPSLG
jgi:hypothetical protein